MTVIITRLTLFTPYSSNQTHRLKHIVVFFYILYYNIVILILYKESSCMKKFDSVKERILDRTLYLIGKNGITNVSVREIATEAGVNVAAINYHFRTKELMFKEMERLFIDNYNHAYDVLDDNRYNAEEKIEIMLNEIMEYTLHYPGVTIIINDKLADKDSEMGKHVSNHMQKKSKKIRELIKQITNEQDDEKAKFYETVLIASVVYPVLNNQPKSLYDQLKFKNKTTREKYIKHIISMMKGARN